MNENLMTEIEQENVVQEEVAENVEQTTEQTPPPVKTFTQEEVNEFVGKGKARAEAKVRKEYERKYGRLLEVLETGTGKKGVDELTNAFGEFYKSKGLEIKPRVEENYTQKDIETLAKAEAEEFIRLGYDDVADEVDRLAEIGLENMTAREKALFKTLAEHRKSADAANALAAIGVDKAVYNSEEFKEFKSMFAPNTPIEKVYETFAKTQPKKQHQTMGSMKQSPANTEKDYYTPEEIEKLTDEDLKNPRVWANVRRSMTGK